MSGGGSQSSLRKALGALKDSTTVSLAKVNSDYKDLDIAIVKATNHVERPAKERHIRTIFSAISATRPRADVAYCIHALSKRLSKTHNWAVASKSLIVIHRALREVDPTFLEELINYGKTKSYMLNMAHFKDNSSEKAWDYSSWVRTYAFFLEERLECFRVLGYDVETDRIRTGELDTAELLIELPMLQQLLYRILGCEPHGAAANNNIFHLALSLIISETVKIYQAINTGINNLVDKFFEMPRNDAVKALDIYGKACRQAELLSEFYDVCKRMDIGRKELFAKIEQPHPSFLQTMEDYVKDAPHAQLAPKGILAIEYKKEELPRQPEPEPEPEPVVEPAKKEEPQKMEEPVVQVPDLLNMNEPPPAASELLEKNAMALAIVPVETYQASAPAETNAGSGWELALVAAPSSNTNPTSTKKLAGGLDMLTLDSLYEEGIRRNSQAASFNPWEPPPYDPFAASHGIAPPHAVQMASQQQAFMLQQQQMMMMQRPVSPYGSNFGTPTSPYPNPYYGLM